MNPENASRAGKLLTKYADLRREEQLLTSVLSEPLKFTEVASCGVRVQGDPDFNDDVSLIIEAMRSLLRSRMAVLREWLLALGVVLELKEYESKEEGGV